MKLRVYDGIAVTGFLTLPALFNTGLSKLAEQNNTAAWLAVLTAFVGMLCLFLAASCLMTRYEGKNLAEITSAVMGRPFGALYGVVLSAYFCFFTGVQIRESTEILKLYGLSLTPVYVIAGLILLTAVVMNFLGGRSIVKSAGIFFTLIVLGIVSILLLGLNRYNPDNLVPVLGNGISDIAENGLFMTSLFDGVIILLLFAPAFSSVSNMRKSGVVALALSAAAYALLSACFVMMFSPSVGSNMMSGVMEMGKSSYYNHFFYRFESIYLFFLIFSAAIQASIGLFIARESLAYSFKLKTIKPVTLVCAAAVLTAVFLPSNILDLTQRYLPVIRQYSVFFVMGVPLLVLAVSVIKRAFKYEKA